MSDAAAQFEQFISTYPAARRQRGYMIEYLFLTAVNKVGFDTLLAAVTQKKKSEQWENPNMIPSIKKWLEEERWIQELPERRTNGDRRQTDRRTPGRRGQVPSDEPL